MRVSKTFLFALAVVMLAGSAFALGISPGKITVIFEPNLKQEVTLKVMGASDISKIESYTRQEGEINPADVLTIKGFVEKNGEITLPVIVDLSKLDYKKLTPGNHRVIIGVRQKAPEGEQFAALVAIQVPIIIFVPYEGLFLSTRIEAGDVEKGEEGSVTAVIKNVGGEKANVASVISIFKEDTEIEKFQIPSFELGVGEEKSITRVFDTSDLEEGEYTAQLAVNVGSYSITKEQKFKVGRIKLSVETIKQEYPISEVSKFEMSVKNNWNEEVKNVYAQVEISDKNKEIIEFKTSMFDVPSLDKGGTAKVSHFFDSSGIIEGRYNMNVTLFYKDYTTNSNYEIEFKKKKISAGLIIGVIAAVLILLVAFWFVMKSRTKGKKSKRR